MSKKTSQGTVTYAAAIATAELLGGRGGSWSQHCLLGQHGFMLILIFWAVGRESLQMVEVLRRAKGSLRGHLDGVQPRVVRAGGDGFPRQRDASAAAPGSIVGADAGGRVGPGADQAGHPSRGH